MKTTLTAIAVACTLSMNAQNQKKAEYPKTRKTETTDTYFGTTVADPYRWLEDDRSAETAAWVKAENEVTFGYLSKIPFRDKIRAKMEKLWNYERISAPFHEGDYMYYYKNDGLQNQAVLYRKDKTGKEEIFLDPNTFSKDGTSSLGEVSFTKDGSLAAYSVSEGGSDWRTIYVIDTKTKKKIGDPVREVKFTGMAWKGNEGFFYSTYDKPKGSLMSAKTDQHKLYYHKLGSDQNTDKVIFGDKEKKRYVGGYVTEDQNYLVISAANSTSGNELYLKDLNKTDSPVVTIVSNTESDNSVLDSRNGLLYISTNYKAPNNRVVTVNASSPAQANWKDLIPETGNVLAATVGGGYIFAEYMKDAVSEVKRYSYDGKEVRTIALPGPGSAGGFSGKHDEKTLYYSFTNYITPGTIFSYNPATGKSEVYQKPKVDFSSDNYISKQVFYTSKDGTKVPMIITYHKDTQLNGKNPTLLYGYGGFNVSLTPAFSIANAVWLENGGVYAVPNLRGGGEYGKAWHDAGTKMQKQNVFDDFIAAAEYLIANKYTSPDYLAVFGGSNGGAYDYGTANDNAEMFNYLKGYSPLHNIRPGVKYPATMVTTGDHDDRVVPAHSFKFAATLQEMQSGPNPVLIRIGVNAGHGAGKSVAQTIAEYSDIQAFILYNMGLKPKN